MRHRHRTFAAAHIILLLVTCFPYTITAFAVNKSPRRQPSTKGLRYPRDCSSFRLISTTPSPTTTTRLGFSRYDSLVSGVAEISIGTSLGVLWSEYAIATTHCGPANLSDGLERLCYQAVIVLAGLILFSRIATGNSLLSLIGDVFGDLEDFTIAQVRLAEWLLLSAVLGAFVALAVQYYTGATMDGLSGIDVEMCRAIRDFH